MKPYEERRIPDAQARLHAKGYHPVVIETTEAEYRPGHKRITSRGIEQMNYGGSWDLLPPAEEVQMSMQQPVVVHPIKLLRYALFFGIPLAWVVLLFMAATGKG